MDADATELEALVEVPIEELVAEAERLNAEIEELRGRLRPLAKRYARLRTVILLHERFGS